MKTQIFADYSAFLNRTDKSINGVTQSFADLNPEWDKERNNNGCWNCSDCSGCSRCYHCSDCSGCSGCSDCSRCSHCSDCSDCSRCSHCSRCSGCSDCSRCSGCSGCSHCSDCSRCSGCSDCSRCSRCSGLVNYAPVENQLLIPVIPNIHSRVREAALETPDSLHMGDWHKCKTTHCRAGWVVTLAGEAGKKLEGQTSTEFAAMAIYGASSEIKVSPVRFYESNDAAKADIVRCAEEEAKQAK